MEDRGLLMVDSGKLPDGWRWVAVEDVCDILDRKRKPITKRNRVPGPYPYYGATGVLDYVEGYLFDEPLVLLGEDGAKWGSGDSTAFAIDGKTWVNNHAHVLRPDRDQLMDEWLIYYLNYSDLSPFITGLTVPKLNQGRLREIPVPLPPLPEQRRIVAILDEVFEGIDRAIANTEQNLANARELFESYLNRVFTEKGEGWVERSIDEIADVKGGKRVPKGYKLIDSPTPYPYISVANFNDDGGVDVDGVRFIDEAVYKQIHRYTISADDVYISIAGTIGKTGIVPMELDGANLTENACRLVIKSEVDKYYLYYFTRTGSFLEQALANTRTTAQPKLALSRLKTIKLPVPSLEVQSFIVDKTRSLEEQTAGIHSHYTRKLAALAEFKQSILRKAFSGELTGAGDQTSEVLKTSEV